MGDKSLTSETAVAYPSCPHCPCTPFSTKQPNRSPLSLYVPAERWKRCGAITIIYGVIARYGFQGNKVLPTNCLVFCVKNKTFYLCYSSFRWAIPSQAGSELWPLPDFESRAYQPDMPSRILLLPAYSAHLLIRVVAESPVYLIVWQSGLYATAHDHATVL